MTQAQFDKMMANATRSVQLLNRAIAKECPPQPEISLAPRVRQSSKPLLNKLEQRYYDEHLKPTLGEHVYAQAVRFRLANGAWYKPDFFCPTGKMAWEIKGPKQMKGIARGMLTIKMAAARYPEILWMLVWWENDEWQFQRILP